MVVNNDGSGSNDSFFKFDCWVTGTALYAMIEFLIWFGFRLTLSIEWRQLRRACACEQD